MAHTKCYVEGYPRPQFVRGNYELLDGEWDFAFDEEDAGERERWQRGHDYPLRIRVPYSYHTPKSGIGREDACAVVWYERHFSCSRRAGERVLLHFDGCDYTAKVWINGMFLGMHEGAYTRFTFDITALLRRENRLSVRCEDRADPAQPRGKQRWTPRSISCFYTETTGIWKSVWLERVPSSYIARVSQEIETEHDGIRYCYEIAHPQPGQQLRVEASVEGRLVAAATADVTDRYGEIALRLVNKNKILPVKYWSPGAPNLIDVTYTLTEKGKVTDAVGSYSALVRYDTAGRTLRLNFQTNFYLKMVLDQGYYAQGGLTGTAQEMEEDVRLIKAMGFNGVRMHEKIEDERFAYYCDAYGLVLWCEMPSMYDYRRESAARFAVQWTDVLMQYRSFPCIMAFVPFNESWGIAHVSFSEAEQRFVHGVYELTKALCPDRLVISNDGWEHTESDLLTTHNYCASGREIRESYADLPAFLSGGRVRNTRIPFAKGYADCGRPFMISECVGICFARDVSDGGWGYGKSAEDEEAFLARMGDILQGICSLEDCCGYCVTQFCDVMQEKNGLLTQERVPKTAIERIAALNDGQWEKRS